MNEGLPEESDGLDDLRGRPGRRRRISTNGVIQRDLAVGGGRRRQSADSATDDVSLRPPDGLRPGRDVPLMALDTGGRFRLACDALQWIIQRRRGKTWGGESFVTTRKVLLRDLRELGCELTPEARASIEALPETFQEWLEQRAAQGGSLGGMRAVRSRIGRHRWSDG